MIGVRLNFCVSYRTAEAAGEYEEYFSATTLSVICDAVLVHTERVNNVMDADSRTACTSHVQCLGIFSRVDDTLPSNLDVQTDFSDTGSLRCCSSSRGTEWYNFGILFGYYGKYYGKRMADAPGTTTRRMATIKVPGKKGMNDTLLLRHDDAHLKFRQAT